LNPSKKKPKRPKAPKKRDDSGRPIGPRKVKKLKDTDPHQAHEHLPSDDDMPSDNDDSKPTDDPVYIPESSDSEPEEGHRDLPVDDPINNTKPYRPNVNSDSDRSDDG
jgi:hypothetical protein